MASRRSGSRVFVIFALAMVCTSSASAALPEFKATGGFPVTFTSSSVLPLEPVLHSSVLGEKNVSCKMSSDKGEIVSTKMTGKIQVTYTECKEEGTINACTTSGQVAGTVVTKPSRGMLAYVLPKIGKTVGIEVDPEVGTVFAEFTCAGFAGKVIVEGCVIGEVSPIITSTTKLTLLFEENAGKNGQLYVEAEGGLHQPCELTVTASVLKLKGKGWYMDREEDTFSKAIEVTA